MRRTLTATAFLIAVAIGGQSAALCSQGSPEPSPKNLDEFDRMFADGRPCQHARDVREPVFAPSLSEDHK
jgi:hypothetical protein